MKKTISIENILLVGTELAVKWSDETESFIDVKLLRDNCPCAFCSGEKTYWEMCIKAQKKNWEELLMRL